MTNTNENSEDSWPKIITTWLFGLVIVFLNTKITELFFSFFWNSMCDHLTPYFIGLLIFIGPTFLVLDSFPIFKNTFGNRQIWKHFCWIGLLIAGCVFYFFGPLKPNGITTRILVAPFRETKGQDPFNIEQNIFRALKEAISDKNETEIKRLTRSISEIDGESVSKSCLTDCDGDALIWGSYSENMISGTLILHVDFANKCHNIWTQKNLSSLEIPVNSQSLQTDLKKFSLNIIEYIENFSPIIADSETCKFKTISKEKTQSIENYLTKIRNVSEVQSVLSTGYQFMANYYYNMKDLSAAIMWISKGVNDFPASIDFLNIRSLIYRANSNPALALADLEKALIIAPENPTINNNIGILKRGLGMLEASLDSYTIAIKFASNDKDKAQFYLNRGSLQELMNEPNSALEDYDHSLQLDSNNLKAYQLRAQVRFKLDNISGANEDLHKFLEKNPDDKNALETDCWIKIKLGNKKQAIEACEKAKQNGAANELIYKTIDALKNGQNLELKHEGTRINIYSK